MKFLLDANLPLGLVDLVTQKFRYDCYRVSTALTDEVIIQQAQKEDRILLTLDTDFLNILFKGKTVVIRRNLCRIY